MPPPINQFGPVSAPSADGCNARLSYAVGHFALGVPHLASSVESIGYHVCLAAQVCCGEQRISLCPKPKPKSALKYLCVIFATEYIRFPPQPLFRVSVPESALVPLV